MPANKGVQAVSQAKNATSAGQKAVTFVRAAGTEVGKDLVNGALSTGVGYGVTELTGNQELGMAAGVLSSFAFGKGLDDIDESLNISGLSRPKGVPKTANYADDFDLSKPHGNTSADVDIVKPKKFNDTSDILENNYKSPVKDSFSGHSEGLLSKNNLGSIYESEWNTKLIRDSNIPIKKNYPTVDAQKSNSHINDIDIGNNNTRFNRLATETVGYGYADDLTVSKTTSSTLSDIYTGGGMYNYSYDSPKSYFSSVDGASKLVALDNTTTSFKQNEFTSSYQERINHTPSSKNKKVEFTKQRGESLCTLKPPPDPKIQSIFNETGIDGIEYKNGVPDFSPVAKAEVEIDHMYGGEGAFGTKARDLNAVQANEKLAEKLNASPELAKKFGMKSGNITAQDVDSYRRRNKLTWHESNNTKTMQLIPTVINNTFLHLGGIGEINAGAYIK